VIRRHRHAALLDSLDKLWRAFVKDFAGAFDAALPDV